MPPSGSGGGRDFLPSTFPTVSVPAASWHRWQCCCRAGTLPSARPEPGTALAHTPSFPQHLICQAATAVPTFHGVFFFCGHDPELAAAPGTQGKGGSAPSSPFCPHTASRRQCGAVPRVVLVGCHHSDPAVSLSHVPSAFALCWQPQVCSHTMNSGKVLVFLYDPARREKPSRLGRILCPMSSLCAPRAHFEPHQAHFVPMLRTTGFRCPCRMWDSKHKELQGERALGLRLVLDLCSPSCRAAFHPSHGRVLWVPVGDVPLAHCPACTAPQGSHPLCI